MPAIAKAGGMGAPMGQDHAGTEDVYEQRGEEGRVGW